jgi:hypothetical protein
LSAITLQQFSGSRPRYSPELLEPDDADIATGLVLGSGKLDPEIVPAAVGSVSKVGIPISLYLLVDRWLHWTTDVDVVRDPKAGDTDDRVIYTGDGAPKFTNYNLSAFGGGTDYPVGWYYLGIPKPAIAASLTIAGGTGGQETRSYVYTFVDSFGSEGPPSDPLTATGFINGTWNFNGMSTTSPASMDITKKRIYRTITSNAGTATYLFVAEITLATANYGDVIAAAALGEELPSTDWVAPDAGMFGIVAMPGGILAAAINNEVCFCEPYQAHAWPAKYRITVDYPIVSLGVFNSNLVVTTTGPPYIITGSHPDSMGMTKVDALEPCISKRSTVGLGFGVAYASPNGLVLVSTAGTEVVTKDILDRDQWQAIVGYTAIGGPPLFTVTAARYRGKYVFFSSAGQVTSRFGIIDRDSKGCYYRGAFFPGATIPKGLFVNIEQEDQLYVLGLNKSIYAYGWSTASISATDLQPVAASRNYHEATWRSKRITMPAPTAFGWCRIEADFSNAHAAYLNRPLTEEGNRAITAATDKSPVGAQGISECAISGGSSVPLFEPSFLTDSTTLKYQQGYVKVTVYADNSQGRSAKSTDAMQVVDTFYAPGAYPIPFRCSGKFDTWQVQIQSTCRVKRVQLATTAHELRGA